ncbi:MAG: hypothetical protein LBF42_00600 [Puniceicoccales bacterium]|jgi:hypothetical protein|nr:hypothetical protein [Puniceicoccales bacterium]
MMNPINIKTLPIEITGVYEEYNAIGLSIGGRPAAIHTSPFTLDFDLVPLSDGEPSWEECIVSVGKDGEEHPGCTDDKRIVRIAKTLFGYEVDGLTFEDLKPGLKFPPEE